MQRSDFSKNAPGRLIKNLAGELAFVPNDLPPQLKWTDKLVSFHSEADRGLAKLSGIGDFGPVNPRLLIRPFVRREAILSSQIEGTRATFSELLLFEQADHIVDDPTSDVREVFNYVRALETGLESLKRRPLGCAVIRELHQQLMTDVRGGDKTPGAYPTQQVFIGRSKGIADARFVPPPHLEVEPLMERFEIFLQEPAHLPALARAALAHYQFEAIHPFHDGNGRVGE